MTACRHCLSSLPIHKHSYAHGNTVAQELETLHRLEVVQLEAFLDAQVQAGKAVPLRDEGAFRRRREAIYATPF